MDMIEKVARALCVAAGHDPDGPTCDVYSPSDPHIGEPWAGYRREARAAIAAMREPTPAMLKAGSGAMLGRAADATLGWQGALNVGWQAMVDEALAPKP